MNKKKIPEFLTKEEQESLINVFNIRYWSSCRNKMLIELDLATGLRLAEIINLKWQDINLITGQLKVVNGKGSKDRLLWLGENTLSKLTLWKEKQYNKFNIKIDYVFTNNKGNQLVDRDVREMVVTYSKKAGITKNISPHTLRHTFATDLLRDCKNIRMVQKALGHADLSTTMIYTHIVDDEFEDALKNFRR
ncbi:tyrosine-type recombinase/integrase [Clostridium scatologenes]|uniref:Integrase family protein n=1 Tax=Clostridium scatologenes TaxID=1548 RepID=A0A0E3K1N6_CLOSL|nr:tyrosine-type recombinase/integrase [Clostridium scatologenes]AKA70145.1 integrase family protein [Clostridium scatologenes]